MWKIGLEGMRCYAFHGVYEEEQRIGQNYILDIEVGIVGSDIDRDEKIEDTINYEQIFQICKKQMTLSCQLLETIVFKIKEEILELSKDILSIEVKIRKEAPPFHGRVDYAVVSYNQDFRKICASCNKEFPCRSKESCPCFAIDLSKKELKAISKRYKGCICNDCLLATSK